MSKPWQQALLSSGLPLESDLRAYLQSKGCIANFEYSYLKPDEHTVEREFSYDLDASYIRGGHFIDLMVECKYRHPGARWVFTPEDYGGPDELGANDFMHPVDDFVTHKFPYDDLFPRSLAPLCNKGVELLADGTNEKTVVQALNQLAYAFAPRVASAIEHQVKKLLGRSEHIFYNVPIVATTAELYRLRDGVRITHIREAKELAEVADHHPCLVMKYTAGAELHRYNATVFNAHIARVGPKALKSALRSYTDDLSHFYSVLSNRYCPRAIVFVTIDPEQSGFERIFHYIDELVQPGQALLAEIAEKHRELAELAARIPRPAVKKQRVRGKK